MRFEYSRIRHPMQVMVLAGGFVLASICTPLVSAADDEFSIFPRTPNAPASAPADEEIGTIEVVPEDDPSAPASSDSMNLDIGRLDRTGRSSAADQPSAAVETNLPTDFSTLTSEPRRVQLRVNVPRQRMAPELESLPLPEGVELGPNDVLAKSAITEIPKGEGYEATVSANTQGKLISLGRQKIGENGEPEFDEEGNPVMIPMHRGMSVQEGEILGVQFNQAFHARRSAAERELEVARKEAGKQLEVEVAEASKNVALMEYKRAVNANKRVPNSVSEDEVWQKRFEWYRGMKSEDKAKYDLEIAALQVDVKEAAIAIADAELEERLIRAPLSGQVDDIFKNRGEWLREGDNVLHVLRLDKVNITVNFDSETVSPSMVQGKAVTVYASKAGGQLQKMEGVITYARPVLMMNRFVAYAEVENVQVNNNWFLIPGMRVNLIVHKDQDAAPQSEQPADAPQE